MDDPEVAVRETPLQMSRAELLYRGFSALLPRDSTQPHRYDHESVTTEPGWPPMYGKFTRFGDVQKLLEKQDDMMVVMGAGDALELEFDVPCEPPPAGSPLPSPSRPWRAARRNI